MTFKNRKVIALLIPLLVLSIAQFYVHASLTTSNAQAQGASSQAVPLVGRLEVHKSKHILVDNNDAESGQTILDAQTLKTSSCASATVHLLTVGTAGIELGQIDLAANTKAVVNYSAGQVKVTLETGCARVRVKQGLEGVIQTPDGKTISATQPDTLDRKLAQVCYPQNNNQDFAPNCIPPIVWILGGGAAAGTTAVAVATRGGNPSPGTPIIR